MPTVDTTRTSTKSLSREERIRLRAEELYRRRGNRPGSTKEDWTRAEKEIWEEEERAARKNPFPRAILPRTKPLACGGKRPWREVRDRRTRTRSRFSPANLAGLLLEVLFLLVG